MSSFTTSEDLSSSDSEGTISLLPKRQRQRPVQDDSEDQSSSDSEETLSVLPPRKSPRLAQCHPNSDIDPEPASGRRRETRRRNNARVIDAAWTSKKTVKITYDHGVKHACMNPVHGKRKTKFKVLHLTSCPWKKNLELMTANPTIEKSKPYQYTHKLCQSCLDKYGPRCFKCDPIEEEKMPVLNTLFGYEAVTCLEGFLESVEKWKLRRDELEVPFVCLHCTVIGEEARKIRRRFGIMRGTLIQVLYSDVRDKMWPAGSGTDLAADSEFKDSWTAIMKERVICQEQALVSFYGNFLLSPGGLTFESLRVQDVLVAYQPAIFDELEARAVGGAIYNVYMQTLTTHAQDEAVASAPDCCLHDAVVHMQRKPTSHQDQCLFNTGSYVASQFYKGVKKRFGVKIISEIDQRVGLGEELKIGDEGAKVPFHCLYVARGGEVRFRRGANASQDVARRSGDARSRICTKDTSAYEIVCWTSNGAPKGGEFVIPGLMYKFPTTQGSSLIIRPQRYFHATLPATHRDLTNEKYAASFLTK